MRESKRQYVVIMSVLLSAIVLVLAVLVIIPSLSPVVSRTDSTTEPTATETTAYLRAEEVVIVEEENEAGEQEEVALPVEKVLFEYIEVVDSCGIHYEGTCLRARGGPGTDFSEVARLRTGMVLKVGGKVERASTTWYKIIFDEWLRYPERVTGDWYVAADYVEVLLDEGDKDIWNNDYATTGTKTITVDRSEQKLYAYDGDALFMEISISTGLELTPTPRGTFTIFKKTPSRYMQGPLPNFPPDDFYDLPGVPWNMYFTHEGAVIHGAYWHNSFGTRYSHGCVNLSPDNARLLYTWADLGTTVTVQE